MSFNHTYKYVNDGCYKENPNLNSETDMDLDQFLTTNFETPNTYNLTEFQSCVNDAENKSKDFFLVTNLKKNNSDNNLEFDCYIPKIDSNCDFDNIEDLISPYNNVINNLIGDSTIRNQNMVNINEYVEISSNDYSIVESTNFLNADCINYTTDNESRVFSKSNYFVIYKTDLIDNDTTNTIFRNHKNMLTNYKEYKEIYDSNVFSLDEFKSKLNSIETEFKDYICQDPQQDFNTSKKTDFFNAISQLEDNYDIIFNNLESISSDISNLEILIKYDSYRLAKVEEQIKEEQEVLNNLLGYDSGANGKLYDTKYMKNLKLSESIILIITLIFLIYFYSKKK